MPGARKWKCQFQEVSTMMTRWDVAKEEEGRKEVV